VVQVQQVHRQLLHNQHREQTHLSVELYQLVAVQVQEEVVLVVVYLLVRLVVLVAVVREQMDQ
jgi:hypothetical protein